MNARRSAITLTLLTFAAFTSALVVHDVRAGDKQDAPLAAPLPKPLFKTHFNSGKGKYVFESRDKDLARIRKAFNAVIIDYGDQGLVEDAREAGLAVIVEFDKKNEFAKGTSIAPVVRAVIDQVRKHPGTIAAIRVADRVNERPTPEEAIAYLQQTGGVFHRELPGVPVIVDVEDWELTCGLPGQTSCDAHKNDMYRYCVNSVLQKIYASGTVDGFELAANLKDDDPDAMAKAMARARKLFPAPFLLYSRSASLSFRDSAYGGDASQASRQVKAYIEAPLSAGLDGIDLWAWHRPWKDELRTFLNKDGSENALWNEMVRSYSAAMPAAGPAAGKK